MIHFTSPSLLWALPGALLPLLIHLLSLRRARKVAFSDLSLLRRVHRAALPRARLNTWLLLACRCALLALLILAYAGPVVSSGGAGAAASEEGLDLVLLLDASYSMGAREAGKTRFDLARDAGLELIRGLKPGDRVAAAAFSERFEGGKALRWLEREEAAGILTRSRLTWRGTEFSGPLRAAYELLAAAPRRRRAAVLLSDGARHGLSADFPLGVPPPEPGVALLGLSWPAAVGNGAALSARPAPGSSAEHPRLQVEVSAFSGPAAPRRALDLWVSGVRAASAVVEPLARELTMALPPSAERGGDGPVWSGRLALEPDALPADDSYHFSMRHARRRRVLCLYGAPGFLNAPQGGYFLKHILAGGTDRLLDYDVDFLELGRSSEPRLEDYQAVLLADFRRVPAEAAARLELFARRGGGLWIVPGARTEADGFSAVDAWLPAHVGAAAASWEPNGIKPAETGPWADFELDRVRIARHHKLEPRPGSRVRLTSPSGEPLLVTGVHGAGRVAVWASALDADWSNLGVKPVFAAWLDAALSEVAPPAASGGDSFQLRVGDPIVKTWGGGEAAPARVKVSAPDGSVVSVWVRDRRAVFPGTDEPGLYVMAEEGGARRWTYAVNPERPRESDLAAAGEAPWRPLRVDAVREDFWLSVYGRDARFDCLAAALILLSLEMLLCLPAAGRGLPGRAFLRGPAVAAALLLTASPLRAQQGDRFVWAQLKLGSTWDPYPGVSSDVLDLLGTVTSVLPLSERRTLTLEDPLLFSSPLVVLAGREAPPALSADELRNLRDFLSAGGTLWLEDVSGSAVSSFDRWVRRLVPSVLPESELSPLEPDHVIYKTFFLLRGAWGRVMLKGALEGASWGGRTAVVYSRNDLLGAWAKDPLGRPLHKCVPGGEPQRHNARKLTLNILMYSMTGSYKADAVHQPYLLQKMRSGAP